MRKTVPGNDNILIVKYNNNYYIQNVITLHSFADRQILPCKNISVNNKFLVGTYVLTIGIFYSGISYVKRILYKTACQQRSYRFSKF